MFQKHENKFIFLRWEECFSGGDDKFLKITYFAAVGSTVVFNLCNSYHYMTKQLSGKLVFNGNGADNTSISNELNAKLHVDVQFSSFMSLYMFCARSNIVSRVMKIFLIWSLPYSYLQESLRKRKFFTKKVGTP